MVYIHIEEKSHSNENLRVLKQRKNDFKNHLIKSFEITGVGFIIMLYLKDCSFIRFALRMLLHSVLSNPFPSNIAITMSDQFKKNVAKQFFYMMLVINVIFTFLDLIVGIPSSEDPTYFYGSLTLQIIGDSKPISRFSYLYYNLIISISQLSLLYLSFFLNVNQEINEHNEYDPETMTYSINQIEGDGYTGQAKIARISPIAIYNEIKTYNNLDVNDDATNNYMGNRLNHISSMI